MGPLTNISLFTGAGGLDLGARIVGGFRTVAYVEKDRYAQGVLMSRIRDGGLDAAPIWDDVCTFDGRHWRGLVDVVSGGFPCQDVSVAGKREGMSGARSGLWREFARIVREVGPRFVLVENVPGLISCGGLGDVLGDLAALGFDADWTVRSAADVGAPHIRARIWIVAHARGGMLRRGDEHRADARAPEEVRGEVREQRVRPDSGPGSRGEESVADANRPGDGGREEPGELPNASSDRRGEGRPESNAEREASARLDRIAGPDW